MDNTTLVVSVWVLGFAAVLSAERAAKSIIAEMRRIEKKEPIDDKEG